MHHLVRPNNETPLFFEFKSNRNPYKNRAWNKVWRAV